jgi:peptide/nickel transport system ATP-binding protein
VSAVTENAVEPATTLSPALQVQDLQIDRAGKTIVSRVSLELRSGETIGIVGESGSGKSMTARALMGLLPRGLTAHGAVVYGGKDLLALDERGWRAIRGRQIGLIPQDPFTTLNPVQRCGRIVEESLVHQLGRSERRAEAARRLAEVGIVDPTVVDRYPFQLSGGMRQRVAIAAALAREPRVLIADEPSTALDVTTQREILLLLKALQRARGMGLILITHDLRVAFGTCDRVYVLYAGSVVEAAQAADLDREPLHPYSQGLLLSEPDGERRVRELVAIPGSVPAPDDVAGCCSFVPRCRWAAPPCRAGAPPLSEVGPGRVSACVRLPEIREEMAAERTRAQIVAVTAPARRDATPLIDVRDVGKVFGSVRAVDSVSIQVGEQEIVGLVGESGSGKSTIARMLVGLERATAGDIVIDGISAGDWSRLSARDRRKLRGTVQMVFQDPSSTLNPMRTVGATLTEAITAHDPTVRRVAAMLDELLRQVGLPAAYAARKPVALSGGERQRVAIARALAARPRILVCDEPVSALDVSVQAQILNLFTALRDAHGLGYLFITHDLSIVRQIADYVVVMRGGRVVEAGPAEQVMRAPQAAYTAELLAATQIQTTQWRER